MTSAPGAAATVRSPSDPAAGRDRPVTIALIWHSMNSDNLGVGALAMAQMAILREAAAKAGRRPHFVVTSWHDPRPPYVTAPDIEERPIRTRNLGQPGGPLGDVLGRADVVFDVGGGDSFTDIYGARRFATIWATKARALAAGKPLVLSPQTIGPFKSAWSRYLARAVMRRAAVVYSRDALSTEFATSMGVSGVEEATDVAMRLPYDAPAPRDGGPVRVGLNVSGLLLNGGYTGANQFGLSVDYPALVRQILTHFTEREGVEVHLVGHVQSRGQPVEDDHRAGEALAAEFPGTVLSPFFDTPMQAKAYIAGMDFFMGARMHATIAAFSAGVPVVPMAYSRKFAGVFGTLGYDRTVDCAGMDEAAIMAAIIEGYEARETLKAEIATARAEAERRLDRYVDFAADLLSRC